MLVWMGFQTRSFAKEVEWGLCDVTAERLRRSKCDVTWQK